MDEPKTTLAAARRRCLAALLPEGSTMRAAGFGYIGFPGHRFRMRQGAAFTSARLRRQMWDDGVITHGPGDGEFRITGKGRVEANLVDE